MCLWCESCWNCSLDQAGFFISISNEIAKSLNAFPESDNVPESHLEELLLKLQDHDSHAQRIDGSLTEFGVLASPRKRIERGFIDWLRASLSVHTIYLNISRNSFLLFIKGRSELMSPAQALEEIGRAGSSGFELTQSTSKTLDIMQKTLGWPPRELMNI